MKTQNILAAAAGLAVGYFAFRKNDGAVGSSEFAAIAGVYPNYHVIKAKYMGPTNYTSARIKLISDRFEQSVTIDYDHQYNGTKDIAIAWLEEHGFNIVGAAEAKDGYYIISNTFEPLKPLKY